ncbi:MAG: hypothetical protein JNN15_19085 [Blastocatellia bacterium]|nr:hypothetical protein [Blastocatellia bacterium]
MFVSNEVKDMAIAVVNMAQPYLPWLLATANSIGEKVVEKIGDAVGEKAPEAVEKVWNKLKSYFSDGNKIEQAARNVVQDPEEELYKQILINKLIELLEANNELLKELKQMIGNSTQSIEASDNSEASGNEQRAKGKGNAHQTIKATGGSKVNNNKQIID